MDDLSHLLEQLQKYQHQNKNLLSENAKLHAKSKRLKMEKKQLKLQLQTQIQSSTPPDTHYNCIEHQTLQFVNHHHIEMQKMIDNLLSHPTIIKSSTYKDLQYISSKLSYIQSKVALATNGKTSTTSPPDLHSQRHHTLTRQQLNHLAPQSMHSYSSETGTDSSSYSSRSHRRSKKHKNKQRENKTHQSPVPNLNMLASRSSPYKPSLNKTKPPNEIDHPSYDHKIYHKRTRSASHKKQSIQQQLKQLEFDKYLNPNGSLHSNESISPLTGPILNHLRAAPVHRKDRSTIISSSSMAVSRATSVVEDLESVMVDCDVDIPPLPPSPHVHNIMQRDTKSNHKHKRRSVGTNHTTHRKRTRATRTHAVQYIPENMVSEYEHPTTPNSGYSAYYENDTTPIRSMRLHTGSMDSHEAGSIGNINCMLSGNTSETNHRKKRAQTKHVLHSQTTKQKTTKRHSNVDWYGRGHALVPVKPMVKPSLTNPPSNNIKEEKEKRTAHKGSRSVAIKNVCVRPQLDINAVSLKLHSHANRSVPAPLNVHSTSPTPPKLVDRVRGGTGTGGTVTDRDTRESADNSGTNPSGGTLKSNSVIIHESQETETTIGNNNSSESPSSSTTNTLSVSSPTSRSLIKKYNERQSIGHVNFVYDFKAQNQSHDASVHALHKGDSMQSFQSDQSETTCTDGIHLKSLHDTPVSVVMNMHRKSIRHSPSPMGSSSYPPTFHLDMDISNHHLSPTPHATKIRVPSRHNKTKSGTLDDVVSGGAGTDVTANVVAHKANATQSTLATESEARVRSKWKLNPASIASSIATKHTENNCNNAAAITKLIRRNTHQPQSRSSSYSHSHSTHTSSCSIISDENKDSMCSNSDGESDTYSESDTSVNTYSPGDGGEGDSRDDIKTYKIKIKQAPLASDSSTPPEDDEGVGGCDDFFDSTTTATCTNGTPFHMSGNEFRPDAISPFGFSVNSARSKTVSAMDLISKKNKRRKLLQNQKKRLRLHQNGIKKHSSFTRIDEMEKYESVDTEQMKEEMLSEYHKGMRDADAKEAHDAADENKNHLSLPNFLSDGDDHSCSVEVRRLSVKEKEKLLMIDDLIASILECPNSYLMTKALLLSHRAFTTSMLLMKVLRRRFRVPHDYVDRLLVKLQSDESDETRKKEIAFKIQLGISQLMYAWMHTYWREDFAPHPLLQKEIYEFQKDVKKFIVDESKENVIYKLLKEPQHATTVRMSLSAESAAEEESASVVSQSGHSASNRSSSSDCDRNLLEIRTRWPHLNNIVVPLPPRFDVLKYKSSSIAQQIVLMDYCVFKEIRPREVVAQAWKKADKWERAHNLLRMINQFNSVCRWIQFSILNCGSSVKHRAKMMKHLICIASSLLEYQDFSALCAVHGALVSTPIKRLRREWKKVPKKCLKMIERISSLFEWNSPKFVELHLKSVGPVIPHLGIILKNVISIEESSEYKADGSINTHKMNLLAQQIEMLIKWQRDCGAIYSNCANGANLINCKSHQLKRFAIKQDLVLQKLLLNEFEQQIHISEDDIFKMSKLCTN